MADKKRKGAGPRKRATKPRKHRKTQEELDGLLFTKRTGRIFQNHRRDAREAGVWIDYDVAGFRRLVKRALDAERCPYCDLRLDVRNFSVDHKVPTSRFGGHSIVNLLVCCKDCNLAKGALDHVEWRQLMLAMASWAEPVRKHTIARLRAGGARMRSAPRVKPPVAPDKAPEAAGPGTETASEDVPW